MNRHLSFLFLLPFLFSTATTTFAQIASANNSEDELSEEVVLNKRFRFSLDVGLGRRIGKLPPGLNADEAQFVNNLMDGVEYGISGTYFINSKIGFGMMANMWNSSFTGRGKFRVNEDSAATFNRDSRDRVVFWGPTFMSRLTGKKAFFNFLVGVGLLEYESKTTMTDDAGFKGNGSALGRTVGTYFQAGIDLLIYKNLYLGFNGHFFTGAISSFEVTDSNGRKTSVELEKGSRESLNRIGGNIGIRFILPGKPFPVKVVPED